MAYPFADNLMSFAIFFPVLIAITMLFAWRGKKKLPPLVGPSWQENLKAFSTIADATASRYPHQFGRMVESRNQHPDGTSVGTGAVFRLAMPQWSHFITVTDYKVARVILEGDDANGIAESEKSTLVRVLDVFPGRGTILS